MRRRPNANARSIPPHRRPVLVGCLAQDVLPQRDVACEDLSGSCPRRFAQIPNPPSHPGKPARKTLGTLVTAPPMKHLRTDHNGRPSCRRREVGWGEARQHHRLRINVGHTRRIRCHARSHRRIGRRATSCAVSRAACGRGKRPGAMSQRRKGNRGVPRSAAATRRATATSSTSRASSWP